jgi:murein DD-endopeptidase MepM/ murein hydrolase activator NlpD
MRLEKARGRLGERAEQRGGQLGERAEQRGGRLGQPGNWAPGWLAAFVAAMAALLALLPPPHASAHPKERLRETRHDLARTHQRLNEGRSQSARLRAAIDRLNRRMIELQMEMGRIEARLAPLRADLRRARARVAHTQRLLARHRASAVRQATELYKSGELDDIAVIFSSDSVSELNGGTEMLGAATEDNVRALVRYGRLRARLERQNRVLFATSTRLLERQAALSRAESLLERKRRTVDTRLGRLEKRNGNLAERERSLAVAAAAIRAKIERGHGPQSGAVSRRGFIWPVNGPITSPFGPRWGGTHPGLDIDGYTGQPYVAAKSGRVISAGWDGGYGNAVIISHGNGVSTLYGHSSALRVTVGQHVDQGEVIGLVGSTGYSTGSHLHFEVRIGQSPVDPLGYLP